MFSPFLESEPPMLKYYIVVSILFLALIPEAAYAETRLVDSDLPSCVSRPWTNCYGKEVAENHLYEGEWRDNKFFGRGILTFMVKVESYQGDNYTYIGDFRDGRKHGRGELRHGITDPKIVESGIYENDRLVQSDSLALASEKKANVKKTGAHHKESDPLQKFKLECMTLGFREGTEKFGTCVLELSKRGGDQQTRSESRTARGDGTPDDATCVGYGYAVGSTGYADCRLKLDQARRDYERELRAYQAEKAAYEQRVAEIEAEKRRQQSERQIRYGACLANCAGDFLSCASRCGYASVGVSPDIGAPPARPSGRTTYVINGRIINCNTTPSGSVVTCN